MRVAILPTGRTEWHGLGQALGRLFPDHEFYCLPSRAEVDSNPESFPYQGFTSCALTAVHESDPPETALELVSRAAQEALGDRRHEAADLVLIIDDVELPNIEQIDRLVAVMRKAVEAHLAGLRRTGYYERTSAALSGKVSFHLVAPMIEAWFFADPEALARAGVPAGATVCFGDDIDPEAFETTDARYLTAREADCPTLAALSPARKKKLRPKWLGALPRERHPKGYLQWLCRAPAEHSCTSYSETESGGPALAEIHWQSLFGRPDTHFAFLRALVEDLEDGLGCAPAVGTVGGIASPLTARSKAPRDPVLRNL